MPEASTGIGADNLEFCARHACRTKCATTHRVSPLATHQWQGQYVQTKHGIFGQLPSLIEPTCESALPCLTHVEKVRHTGTEKEDCNNLCLLTFRYQRGSIACQRSRDSSGASQSLKKCLTASNHHGPCKPVRIPRLSECPLHTFNSLVSWGDRGIELCLNGLTILVASMTGCCSQYLRKAVYTKHVWTYCPARTSNFTATTDWT